MPFTERSSAGRPIEDPLMAAFAKLLHCCRNLARICVGLENPNPPPELSPLIILEVLFQAPYSVHYCESNEIQAGILPYDVCLATCKILHFKHNDLVLRGDSKHTQHQL